MQILRNRINQYGLVCLIHFSSGSAFLKQTSVKDLARAVQYTLGPFQI
jgi:hypothetical protein